MERTKLKVAREAKNVSRQELADAIKCSKEAIGQWERGDATPQDHWILELCTFFRKDPGDLDLASELTESELAMLQDILKNRTVDRRQALAIMTLPAFAGVDFSSLSKPLVSQEQFLRQAEASVSACWQLMKSDGTSKAESLLVEYMPTLESLAVHPSRLQTIAASVATEGKILQTIIAGQKLNYRAREICCAEAVQFGELSGNHRLHVAALDYQGYTYTYYFHQPQRAIGIFNDGLARLNSDALLSKSSIFIGLAIAHAQEGNETEALKMAEQARKVMPEDPEQDPFYYCVDFGPSVLDEFEGRMLLALAESLPGSNYAQRAYDAFDLSTNKQAIAVRYQGQALIGKAIAAYAIGDLDEYARCLEQGILIALRIDSKKSKQEARAVLNKAPDEWKREQKYQELVKMF